MSRWSVDPPDEDRWSDREVECVQCHRQFVWPWHDDPRGDELCGLCLALEQERDRWLAIHARVPSRKVST